MSQTLSNKYHEGKRKKQRQQILLKGVITTVVLFVLSLFLSPFFYGASTSLKTSEGLRTSTPTLLPTSPILYEYEGDEYKVYEVPIDGENKELALFEAKRAYSLFVDPQNPTADPIRWEGKWRTLDPVTRIDPAWGNFAEAFDKMDFLRMFGNTVMYAGVTMIGALISGSLVAYGFARFNFPFKNLLFIIMIGTIILPPQMTIIPAYALFVKIGWAGTWKPLILPQFFSNAYNVFLLRQYFMTIPREMEEAAKIDGAGPLRTFWSIILPQAKPAMTAVCLFHLFWAWNDYLGPLIYLTGEPQKAPLSVGLTTFRGLFGDTAPHLMQAGALMALFIPMLIFFFAQRVFVQGIVITGNK